MRGTEASKGVEGATKAKEVGEDRQPLAAVGWLLGPDLIARLRRILGARHDPRAWMTTVEGYVHDELAYCDGRLILDPRAARQAGGELKGPPAHSAKSDSESAEKSEIWFDYASDMGDSGDAMYAVAYACQIDLHCDRPLEPNRDGTFSEAVLIRPWRKIDRGSNNRRGSLPRGQFLFIGGDTAYHIADKTTLRQRVQTPFLWAWEDLDDDVGPLGREHALKSPARLYGIPGNHDWYDHLNGFGLLFQETSSPRPTGPYDRQSFVDARGCIPLPGFRPVQYGSYAAIKLPHRWELWGLDIDSPLDPKQRRYFLSVRGLTDLDCDDSEESKQSSSLSAGEPPEDRDPERLILCTPSPPIVFGSIHLHKEHAASLRGVRLSERYLTLRVPAPEPSPTHSGVRLDLSGDTHHYTRYQPNESSYAAVVSGLGGAFHHPTFTKTGEIPPVNVYPAPKESRRAVSKNLLTYRTFIVGSWMRAFPFVVTMFFGFVVRARVPASELVQSLVRRLVSWVRPPNVAIEEPDPIEALRNLMPSLMFFCVLVAAGACIWTAVKLFDLTFAKQTKEPWRRLTFWDALRHRPNMLLSPWRSYWPSTAVGGLAVLGVLAFRFAYPRPPFGVAMLNVIAVLLLLAGPMGGAVVAATSGSPGLPAIKRFPMALVGSLHGTLQILTPILLARFASVPGSAYEAITQVVVAALILVATWALLRLTRWPFNRDSLVASTVSLCSVGFLAWAGAAWALIRFAPTTWVHPSFWLYDAALCSLGALLGAGICTSYFGWYLAIAGRLDGHNNEVGGAARVAAFRQIIRFHLNAHRLRGYVISVEDAPPPTQPKPSDNWLTRFRKVAWGHSAARKEVDLQFRVIDIFDLPTPPPP